MPTLPQLMLDTNVCGKLVDLYEQELPRIIRRMNHDFRLVTSPQTLAELMYGIVNGTGEHLDCDKQKIRTMLGTKEIKVLQYPAIFAVENVLGLAPDKVKQRMPSEMAMRVKILLRAPSYQALVHDGVRIPSKGRRKKGRLLPEMLMAEMQAGIDDHNDLMKRVRNGKVGFPTPHGYAKSLAKGLGHIVDDEQVAHLLLLWMRFITTRNGYTKLWVRVRTTMQTKRVIGWTAVNCFTFLTRISTFLPTTESFEIGLNEAGRRIGSFCYVSFLGTGDSPCCIRIRLVGGTVGGRTLFPNAASPYSFGCSVTACISLSSQFGI